MSRKAEEGKALWAQGFGFKEIAQRLGVAQSTVRTWKNRDAAGWPKQMKTRKACQGPQNLAMRCLEARMVEAVEHNTCLSDAEKTFCLHFAKTFNADAAYRRAFPPCRPALAHARGLELCAKPRIREEVLRLKKMRQMEMLASAEDVVERMMRIAFADLSDYVQWGRTEVPVTSTRGVVTQEDASGVPEPLMREVNEMRFLESAQVDGTLLCEVRQSRDGASVKLADRMAALRWLADYFELNPADRHRREFDLRRLALQEEKQNGEETMEDVVFRIVPAQGEGAANFATENALKDDESEE